MPKKFDRLAKKVEKEYRSKGYSKEEARGIGYATAHKIYGKKHR